MFKILTIQLTLLAIVAAHRPTSVYTPSVWEFAKIGNKRHFYLNTYGYCNYTIKAMDDNKKFLFEKTGNSGSNGADVHLDGKKKHLGCGKITLTGGDGKNFIVCANFRNNWTEGICRINGGNVQYTVQIYENIHVYNRKV
uniref:Hypothetical secreted protein n=1 Tax=Simulium vittatum TaxID=7192 RepID=B5M0S2_SIMVI|nr:hypothetical secreted protein [Simulium vittatum]